MTTPVKSAPAEALRAALLAPQLSLALAALLWSGNFVAGRALRDAMSPLDLNFWRWSIALVVLLPLTAASLWRQWPLLRERLGFVLSLAMTGVVIPHACVYQALRSTTAVNALILMTLTPLLIVGGARLVFGQAVRAVQWAGMLVSMAGAVLLTVRGSLDALLALELHSGDLWMIPVALAAAAQALLLRRTPAGVQQAPLLTASVLMAVVLMAVPVAAAGGVRLPQDRSVWLSLLYIGIFASAVAFFFWNRGVAAVGPSRAAPHLFLMPVYGSLLGLAWLGEPVRGFQLACGAVVLGGVWLARPSAPAAGAGAAGPPDKGSGTDLRMRMRP